MERERVGMSYVRLQDLKPHFLFNALNSVKCSVILDDINKVDLIDDFSAYLRYIFQYSNAKEEIAARKIFDFLQSYTRLEEARYDQIEVLFELETLNFVMEPMTLFEIVYNAIHHGLKGNAPEGKVWIRTRKKDKRVYIEVEDNGVGAEDRGEVFFVAGKNLFTIRENMRKKGASISVISQKGQGTVVQIEYEEIGE